MVDEVESYVVGGGLSEVPHDQLDDVLVGGVRLHEQGHLSPHLLGLEPRLFVAFAFGSEGRDQTRP